jgi:hypothetical protein
MFGSFRWRKEVGHPSAQYDKAISGLKKRGLEHWDTYADREEAKDDGMGFAEDGMSVEILPIFDSKERYDYLQYEVWAKRVKRRR